MRSILLVFIALFACASARAQTQCLDDAECAPGQRCVSGSCAVPPPPAPSPYNYNYNYNYGYRPRPAPADSGWAGGAGVFGLVTSGLVVGLAGASEGTKSSQIPSLPLGITATVLFATAVPIVAAGGASARRDGVVRGVLALRVLGWVFYGLSLAEAGGLIALGGMEIKPPDGMIISTGLLGFSSLAMMSIDALVSRAQANDRRTVATRSGVQLWPTLSAGGVGMAGRF